MLPKNPSNIETIRQYNNCAKKLKGREFGLRVVTSEKLSAYLEKTVSARFAQRTITVVVVLKITVSFKQACYVT